MGVLRWSAALGLVVLAGCYQGNPGTDAGQGATDTATGGDDDGGSGDESGGQGACIPEGINDRATLRRLTRQEYNNTVRDLLGDATLPANAFPSEELGNGFGNDADAQPVSSLLAEQYNAVAESVATRATETPAQLAKLAACAGEITDATDSATADACAADLIGQLLTRAYRRPLAAGEADDLVELSASIRQQTDFATSIAAVLEAVLQSPDFLYRVERGRLDDDGRRRPTDYEMATRLSYAMWGTMPDATLMAAAASGELSDAAGVLAHAERMLDDERSRPVVRFFFDNLLPISALASLERDPARYPKYTPAIGALMREETQRFIAYEIFEGSGTWDGALTAPYTFVNGPLAEFYGIPGVQGDDFVKVDVDPTQRLGLLTQAGVVSGTIHSNETNPVVRGAFLMRNVMCTEIPLPEGDVLAEVKPPDPDSGATGRERYSEHSSDPVCAGCHSLMDPIGLTLENYDPIGLWRDTENGVTIDASGGVPGVGPVGGPLELVQAIAGFDKTHACFATKWSEFAYGRTHAAQDACTQAQLEASFTASGHDIRQLLLDLTQTDDFLYMPTEAQ